MHRHVTRFILTVLLVLTAAQLSAVEYTDYKRRRQLQEYFEISFNKEEVILTGLDQEILPSAAYSRTGLEARDGRVYFDETVLFDNWGFQIDENFYYWDSVADSRITEDDDYVIITFYTRTTTPTRAATFRQGNLFSFDDDIDVDDDDFVRGMVFSVFGDIGIYGEVNKDVIAILGEIYVAPGAVVRGDIATVAGRIDAAREASVYGEMYYVDKRGIRRRYHFKVDLHDWDLQGNIVYNRVDGLALSNTLKYFDIDSLLPTVWANVGYALNSERWRYDVGAEQTFLRHPIAIVGGGGLYRRLASEDDWLLGNRENTAFALLATEDFKDYYEAEGGTVYLKIAALDHLSFESRYRHEQTHWLDARRHLWSMFGGSKLFSENFSTVDSAYRAFGIDEIDSTTNVSLYNRVAWDTRDPSDPFSESSWYASADFEWSDGGLNSDFDYRRYTLAVRRYQEINRRTMLILRGVYGGSDGYLPMYKRFFLGGLGTLRGYDHKEYMGTRFWMTNIEYRIDFRRVETAVSVFWDAGQIANERKLDGEVDVKNNLGIAFYLGDDFKVSLAKRLDRSFDDNPIFYVRLDHVF